MKYSGSNLLGYAVYAFVQFFNGEQNPFFFSSIPTFRYYTDSIVSFLYFAFLPFPLSTFFFFLLFFQSISTLYTISTSLTKSLLQNSAPTISSIAEMLFIILSKRLLTCQYPFFLSFSIYYTFRFMFFPLVYIVR